MKGSSRSALALSSAHGEGVLRALVIGTVLCTVASEQLLAGVVGGVIAATSFIAWRLRHR